LWLGDCFVLDAVFDLAVFDLAVFSFAVIDVRVRATRF